MVACLNEKNVLHISLKRTKNTKSTNIEEIEEKNAVNV